MKQIWLCIELAGKRVITYIERVYSLYLRLSLGRPSCDVAHAILTLHRATVSYLHFQTFTHKQTQQLILQINSAKNGFLNPTGWVLLGFGFLWLNPGFFKRPNSMGWEGITSFSHCYILSTTSNQQNRTIHRLKV